MLTGAWVSSAGAVPEARGSTPDPGSEGAFSFIVWGHPRGRDNGVPPLHFEEILGRIAEADPDLVVVTGDVVLGGQLYAVPSDQELDLVRQDWERFDSRLAALGIPVYVVPGNHDVHSVVTRDLFAERHRLPPYGFSFRESRFILLDTVGIVQQAARMPSDGPPFWSPAFVPFDAEQLEFLRNEIAEQDASRHLFLFMHHLKPWRDANGFWWRDVHPMLKGGRTRVVFSGTPGDGKYLHHQEDGIHYILSCTLQSRGPEYFRNSPSRDEWALYHALDNLQWVRIHGDEIEIRTIIVGERDSAGTSPRFWDEASRHDGRRELFAERFHEAFVSFESLALGAAGLGGVGALTGLLLGWALASRR